MTFTVPSTNGWIYIYDTIVYICKEQQVACNSYRQFFHPHFPEGPLLLTASPE